MKLFPKGKLTKIEYGARKQLWQKYRVTATPTLMLRDSKSGRETVLVGLQKAPELVVALHAIQQSETKK